MGRHGLRFIKPRQECSEAKAPPPEVLTLIKSSQSVRTSIFTSDAWQLAIPERENHMRRQNLMAGMLAEAVAMLERADRLPRQFFWIGQTSDVPRWEPSVDVYKRNHNELGVLVALPGVAPDRYEVTLEDAVITVRGERLLEASTGSGAILRLEIPYGRFERRINLPYGSYRVLSARLENGCLRLHLENLNI
jgi:HSP20 family protein